MQHVNLYVFMDKKTGRFLGQFEEYDGGLYSLFDLPEEEASMGQITFYPTIKGAKEFLKWFLPNLEAQHYELAKELESGTAKLDIVAYEYKKVIE